MPSLLLYALGIIMGQLVSTLQPEWRLRDFAPLIAVYTIVFLYISFSVGECLVFHTFSKSRKQPNAINRGIPYLWAYAIHVLDSQATPFSLIGRGREKRDW